MLLACQVDPGTGTAGRVAHASTSASAPRSGSICIRTAWSGCVPAGDISDSFDWQPGYWQGSCSCTGAQEYLHCVARHSCVETGKDHVRIPQNSPSHPNKKGMSVTARAVQCWRGSTQFTVILEVRLTITPFYDLWIWGTVRSALQHIVSLHKTLIRICWHLHVLFVLIEALYIPGNIYSV